MFPYWLLFGIIAVGAAIKQYDGRRVRTDGLLLIVLGLTAIMIGLRFEVGGDWWAYKRYFSFASRASFAQIIGLEDPGYQFLNWIVARAGFGIWLVNLVCGSVFSWGLYRLIRLQPYPWLSLLVAVPYLIIVVAMGYTRQAVAIGILMAGMASVKSGGSILRYALFVTIAATFHRTAVVALPLLLMGGQRSFLINALIVGGVGLALYDVFLSDSFDRFVEAYVDSEMASQGAAVRIAMGIVPAALFLRFHQKMVFSSAEKLLWRNMSAATFLLLAGLLLTGSSTIIDRLALYVLPLQLAVLPRVIRVLGDVRLGKALIIAYCFTVQVVWLNFAEHSNYWLPYQLFPIAG